MTRKALLGVIAALAAFGTAQANAQSKPTSPPTSVDAAQFADASAVKPCAPTDAGDAPADCAADAAAPMPVAAVPEEPAPGATPEEPHDVAERERNPVEQVLRLPFVVARKVLGVLRRL